MDRRNIRLALALNIVLATLLMVSFVTGWIAVLLGLTEFGLHKYASIALTGAIVIHVGLHYRMLTRRKRSIASILKRVI